MWTTLLLYFRVSISFLYLNFLAILGLTWLLSLILICNEILPSVCSKLGFISKI